jgi:hydroxylysine kinase
MGIDLRPARAVVTANITERDVERWCDLHFGIQAKAERLTGEVDLNFRVDAADGRRFVAKLAAVDEKPEVLDFQTKAMAYAIQRDPFLPIPQTVESRSSAAIAHVGIRDGEARMLRLLTWQDGTPLHLLECDALTRTATGDLAARLTMALDGFEHLADDRPLLWDMKQAASLQQKSKMLPHDLQALISPVFHLVLDGFMPKLAAFPAQVIHNDLNLHNLLIDPHNHGIVSGCLDFGDMVRSPRICDVAIAAFYQADPAADCVGTIGELARAYHARLPLSDDEWRWLVDLAAMRAVMTVIIANWRASLHPHNAAYLLRNEPAARAFLEAHAGLDEKQRRFRLLDESRSVRA